MTKITAFECVCLILGVVMLTGCNGKSEKKPNIASKDSETTVWMTEDVTDEIETTEETDSQSTEENALPDTQDPLWELEVSPDKKHQEEYFSLMDSFEKMVGRQQYAEYIEIFSKTADFNRGALFDYFGIERATYEGFADSLYQKWISKFTAEQLFSAYPFTWEYDAWFSDDYENHPIFLIRLYEPPATASVRIRCETDETHTNRYYTIDYRLIDYVTPAAFEEFRTQFGGTEDFNILHFIEYFEIDREEYCSLYTDIPLALPYDPDYLYGNEEMQEKYFCRHPAYLWS